MTTIHAIRSHVSALAPGELFSPSALQAFGTRAAIDQALSRLTRAGELERVTRGLYQRPKVSRFVGRVPPEPMAVAQALADMHGETIEVSGAEAARRLGLTTQVPVQPVFLTNGRSREIQIGKLVVVMRHVSSNKLALAGRRAGLALVALWDLGRQRVTHKTFTQLAERLSPEEFEELRHARSRMPGWMAEALRQYEHESAHA